MIVHQCPLNKSDWDTASQKLQCVDPNSYHCLRTEDGGETEQCLAKVWIQERMCPDYNSKVGKIDVYSCKNSEGCPLEIYWSDEVYKYPACSEKKDLETTTTPTSIDGVSGKDYTVLYITVVSSVLFVITFVLLVTICYIRRKRRRNTRNEERQTPELTEPHTVSDIRNRFRQTPEHFPLTDNGTPNDYLFSRELSPLTVNDSRNANRLTQELFPLTANVAEHEIDPGNSDIEDLKKHGVLVFISNDRGEMGQRMKFIADSGEFGESRFEHSLNLWDAENDISLYLFRQPIKDVSSLVERSDKLIDMYRRVKQSPKTYFVLYFGKNEWERYQNKLIEFDFFKIAKRKMM